jgi:hypothetical protein
MGSSLTESNIGSEPFGNLLGEVGVLRLTPTLWFADEELPSMEVLRSET